MDIETARAKVGAPGTALIVYAILSFLTQIFSVLSSLLGFGGDAMGSMYQYTQGVDHEVLAMVSKATTLGGGCISMLFAAVILFAGLKMKDLQSYGLCVAGAVLALLPCNCCCCWVGLPIGGWALATLMNAEVKAAFQAAAAEAMG